MNLEDITIAPPEIPTEKWQLANIITHEIKEQSIVLIICPDYRGGEFSVQPNTEAFRTYLYGLSKADWQIPVVDLGDLKLGKTIEDTHFAVEELISYCLYQKAIPILIGGSLDLVKPQIFSLNFHHKNFEWSHIGAQIILSENDAKLTANNALFKVFTDKQVNIKNFHFVGYQQHLNDWETLKLMENVDFDLMRLAEIMETPENAEPFFRRSNFVSIDCNAVESRETGFSTSPQINGLTNREVCSLMKEAGLSQELKSVGLFNFSFEGKTNTQLLAQMIWYLIDGIQIQKTHPNQPQIEQFTVLFDDKEYHFKREIFSNLWYFGEHEDLRQCLPCTLNDYENAKRGEISKRILNYITN